MIFGLKILFLFGLPVGFCLFWGHGVVAGASPGVAAADAAYGQPESAHGTVDAQCFEGVGAARGGEAARGRCQWRDAGAVEPHGAGEQKDECAANHLGIGN